MKQYNILKHKIIIKYYTGNTQKDYVFYGNCALNVINKEIVRTEKRIRLDDLKASLIIFPDVKQYLVFNKTKGKIIREWGYLTDEEYEIFVLDRYFNK